ncbi:unnamed protein product [Ranitomeya imitator]|uniref:Uncharacterized protein n=1 Tax=Ranitomeya imitator TaxID=111125 RepID=A0ABN9KP00_9NEOB|nr:unnamed protein product [Ranitomeya imitator]
MDTGKPGLVHDEHLQHQGWAAIMANLEDCTHSYQKLLFKFDNAYSRYIQSVDDMKMKLTNLGTAVSVMAKIPLLECLTRHSYRMCLDRLMSSLDGEIDELDTEKTTDMVQYDETKLKNTALLASLSTSGEHVSQEVQDNLTEQENPAPVDPSEELMAQDSPLFNVSLLDWINVQDRPNDVESLVRKCFDSMSRRLHYKTLTMTYKAIHNLCPPYICDLVSRYLRTRNLRSSQDLLLYSPLISSSHNRIQDFSRVSPLLWNPLPQHIRLSPTIETFKKNLKTHLFRQAYNLQ